MVCPELVEVKSLASSNAPHSSSLGIESCFKGATLVLAATNALDETWLSHVVLIYTTAE